MSALSAIDMSGDFLETTGAVVTGTMAREMATKAAKMVRVKAMNELSGDKDWGQPHTDAANVIV